MEHKHRWRARLYLLRLEDRTQPGALFTAGIDLGGLAEVIGRSPQQETLFVTKQIDVVDEDQSEALQDVTASIVSAPSTKGINLADKPTRTVARNTTNAILPTPGSEDDRPIYRRQRAGEGTKPRPPLTGSKPHPYSGPVIRGTGELSDVADGLVDHGGGSGSRSLNFVNYDFPGTLRADVVNDVAPGRGLINPGDVYVAGGQGRAGTLKRYSSTGALEAMTTFAFTPGHRVQLTGVDVSADGSVVYVTGRETVGASTTVLFNFVHAVPATLGGAVSVAARLHKYPELGPGTVQNLEDITVSPFDGDIVVTGSVSNSTGSYNETAHFRYNADATMSVVVEQSWDHFTTPSDGYSVVVDAETGLQIFGGAIDINSDGVKHGANFAIANNNQIVPYAYVDDCNFSFGTVADPDNGEWGEVIVNDVGGDEDDDRLYLSGSFADPTYSPTEPGDSSPYDNLFIAEVKLLDGSFIVYDCLTIGAVGALDGIGGDYTSRGSAFVGGFHVVAGAADFEGTSGSPQSIHRAHNTAITSTGAVASMRTYGDGGLGSAFNRTTEARGITVLATGEVATGGITNVPEGEFTPTLTAGNDTTFASPPGPPSDGYYASDDLPFGAP